MAVINVNLSTENLIPVNNTYVFTASFINTTTGSLIDNEKFPQNQVFTFNNISDEIEIPVKIGDGQYPINNISLKIVYKDKILTYPISNQTVNCLSECNELTVSSVSVTNNTTLLVNLGAVTTATYSWKIFSSINSTLISSGTSNTTNSNSFNITTPTLANGNYLLEVNGVTCRGKKILLFSVSSVLPACKAGPTLLSILNSSSTSLTFQFDGLEVFGITWRIKQGSNVIRNGVISYNLSGGENTYNNSTPTINYAALLNNTYTLEIEGNTCSSSVTTKTFTINNVETPLAFISGYPQVTGSSGNYTINIKINKTGPYNTVVLNTTTGSYFQNGSVTYTDSGFSVGSLPVGNYAIKVGTLETILTIQNTGGSPCSVGPTLQNVVSSSTTGLAFLFDGQNVTAITWRIKQNGTLIRNGVVYPTNNTPFITYNEIPEGNYTLEIEGNNCTSNVSSGNFTVVNIPQGNNAGVIVTNVGNKYIGIINGRNFKAVANPTTGKVRLIYDEFSTAESTSTPVKGWVLRSQLQETPSSELNLLKSSEGLLLPDGSYNFYLYYFPTNQVSSFDQIKSKISLINNENWPQFSRTLEEVIIEVRTNPTL